MYCACLIGVPNRKTMTLFSNKMSLLLLETLRKAINNNDIKHLIYKKNLANFVSDDALLEFICKTKDDKFFNYVVNNNMLSKIYEEKQIIRWAAMYNNFFNYIVNNGMISSIDEEDIMISAAIYGNIDMIKFFINKQKKWHRDLYGEDDNDEDAYQLDSCITYYAAGAGQLDFLKYLVEECHPECWEWHEKTMLIAAQYGHLSVIKYVRKQTGHNNNGNMNFGYKILACAAFHGQLHVVKYLLADGIEWDTDVVNIAVFRGHVNILQYAHESRFKIDDYTMSFAVEYGHQNCIAYIRDIMCGGDFTKFATMLNESAMARGYIEFENSHVTDMKRITDGLDNGNSYFQQFYVDHEYCSK